LKTTPTEWLGLSVALTALIILCLEFVAALFFSFLIQVKNSLRALLAKRTDTLGKTE